MKNFIVDEKAVRKRMIDLEIKTINELAVQSGVSKPTIYDYLNGKSPFSTAFLRLCVCLEINPDDILIQTDDIKEDKDNETCY